MIATQRKQRKPVKRLNLSDARTKKGFTRKDLANRLEVSEEHVRSLEYGRVDPSITLMFNICATLDSTPQYLFSDVISK